MSAPGPWPQRSPSPPAVTGDLTSVITAIGGGAGVGVGSLGSLQAVN
ncbi:MAG TPA: hypothetical protein V6D02_05800 [Candidatus Obscuribacterales bacterium]